MLNEYFFYITAGWTRLESLSWQDGCQRGFKKVTRIKPMDGN